MKMLGSHDSVTLPPTAGNRKHRATSVSASRHLKELQLHWLPTPTAHVHGMTPNTVPTSTHSLQAAPTSPPAAHPENGSSVLSVPSLSPHPAPPHPTSSARQSLPAPPSNSPGLDHSAPQPWSNLLQYKRLPGPAKISASPSGRPHPRSTPGLKILPGSRLPQNKIQSHSLLIFFIQMLLIYNIVLLSAAQQRDSVRHTYTLSSRVTLDGLWDVAPASPLREFPSPTLSLALAAPSTTAPLPLPSRVS